MAFRLRPNQLLFRLLKRVEFGGVAELADALDLGSSALTGVQVQFLSPPLKRKGSVAISRRSLFSFHDFLQFAFFENSLSIVAEPPHSSHSQTNGIR